MNDDKTTPSDSVSNPPSAAAKTEPIADHPEFQPSPSAKPPGNEVPVPSRTKTPWQPKAAITTAQRNDVIRAAQSANKFRFDQVVAHPDDNAVFRIRKIEGANAILALPDNSTVTYPVAELFDPEAAEQMAAQLVQSPGESIAAPAKKPEGKVRDQSPGTGPAGGAVTLLVAAAIAFMSMFGTVGCGNGTNGTGSGIVEGETAQSKAANAIEFAEAHAGPITTAAVTAFLLSKSDPAQRAVDAQYIYAGASALNIFTTGTVPTAEEIEATVRTFMKGDPRYVALAQIIVAQYANVYPLFKIANKSPVKLLVAIEMGAMNGAKPFLKPAG